MRAAGSRYAAVRQGRETIRCKSRCSVNRGRNRWQKYDIPDGIYLGCALAVLIVLVWGSIKQQVWEQYVQQTGACARPVVGPCHSRALPLRRTAKAAEAASVRPVAALGTVFWDSTCNLCWFFAVVKGLALDVRTTDRHTGSHVKPSWELTNEKKVTTTKDD